MGPLPVRPPVGGLLQESFGMGSGSWGGGQVIGWDPHLPSSTLFAMRVLDTTRKRGVHPRSGVCIAPRTTLTGLQCRGVDTG